MAKSDGTGSYSHVCDGTTPGSPVLSDGHTIFTAGLSSTVAGLTSFRHEDALGSLRYLTDSSQNVLGSSVYEAFGVAVGATGSTAKAPFGWVGGADCQTEADTGLVLMGHRLYDSRLGRFLSQDPAGDGDNWYSYVGNDPINKTDPMGLYIRAMPPLHGAFSSDPGGLFGGQNSLDDFFSDEDDARQRGQDSYQAAVATQTFAADPSSGGFWADYWRGILHELATAGRFQDNPTHFKPRSGAGGGNAAQDLSNMSGKTRAEADALLKGKGFNYKGKTEPGGYEKYYHPDGSRVLIRPNGEVTRSAPNAGGGYRPRIDQYGQVIPRSGSHSTGEMLRD